MSRFARTAIVIFAVLLLSGLTFPYQGFAAKPEISVEFASKAKLVDAGTALMLKVSVSCPQGYQVLEAFMYIVQDGLASQYAGIPVQCSGKQTKYEVRVPAFEDSPFHSGDAFASAYVLLQNGELSGGAFQVIRIK